MLNGMRIGAKILGGYMVVILLLVLVAGVAIFSIQNLNGMTDELVHHNWPQADAAMEMSRTIEETQGLLMEYWINDTVEDRAEFRAEFDSLTKEFDDLNEEFLSVAEDEEDAQTAEALEEMHNQYLRISGDYMDALDDQAQTKAQLEAHLEEVDPYIEGLDGEGKMYELIDHQKLAFYDFLTFHHEEHIQEIADFNKQIKGFAGYAAIAQDHGAFYDLVMEVVSLDQDYDRYGTLASEKEDAVDQLKIEFHERLEAFRVKMDKHFDETGVAAVTTANTSRMAVLLIGVLAAILGIILGIILTRMITKPLNKIVTVAQQIAEGDLTQHVEVKSRDEIGDLAQSFNQMTGQLNTMMQEIMQASEQVATSSEEISSSAQQLSSGSQNQASTLEETSASVEEMTASVEQVADHAQNQAASVEESSTNMEQMQGSVDQVSKTITEVSTSSQEAMEKAQSGVEAVSKAVEAIKSISTSSEQIAGIINVISDIADQTNLLALNASIEAARAGEHGRGFAVVADEVSKLADRSSSSTKEIENLISESGKNVNMGVEIAQAALGSMDEIIAGAQKTNEMVSALASDIEQQIGAIKEVAKATESISEMSQSISAATEEQTTNAKQVSKAIENVNELTQQAAGSAEEMSAATEELSTLAQQMQRLVEQFRLSEDMSRQLPQPKAAKHGGMKRQETADKHLFTPAGEADVTAVALKKRMNKDAA